MTRAPGGARRWAIGLLLATTLSRLPVTVFAVLFVLESQLYYGRLGPSGAAILAYALGSIGNGVISGALFARIGHVGTVAVTAVAAIVVMVASAVPGVPGWWFIVCAGLIGLTFPPLHIGSRALYPRMLSRAALLRIYSWDVSLVQISWIAAPTGILLLAGGLGVQAAYAVLILAVVIGAVWYLSVTVRFRPDELPHRTGPIAVAPATAARAPLLRRELHVYASAVALIMFVSGLILPGLLRVAGGSATNQAILVLVWSIGSTTGSIVVNRTGIRRHRLVLGVAAASVAGAVAAASGAPVVIGCALVVLGFATSPITGAVFFFLSQRFDTRAQVLVFATITSVQLVAEGIGSSTAGPLLDADALPVLWGLLLCGVLGLLAVVAANPTGAFSGGTVPRAVPVRGRREEAR